MWTRRALNRSLLARQGLLAPFAEPLPRVLERIGGIQAQYAPSMYVGLWSRTRGFRRDDLTRALEDRSVVQGTLLRATILPEVHRPRVFATRIPQSVNTFLVDGEVAGSWKWDRDHVALEPFAPLPAATLRAVEEAATPLADLYA